MKENKMHLTPSATTAALFAIVLGGLSVGAASAASAQSRDTFIATAAVNATSENPDGIRVAIVVDHYATEAENSALRNAVRHGTTALRAALSAMPDIGAVTVAGQRIALKYAYQPPKNGGRTIVMLAAAPVVALTTAADPPKAGFDLALVTLDFSTPGFAIGQIDPAVKVTTNADGLIVSESQGAASVRLSSVERQ
jgi:hypothetical protein